MQRALVLQPGREAAGMEGPQDGQGPQGTQAPREPPVSDLSGPQDSQCLGDPQCSQDPKCRRSPQSPEVLPHPWCPQSPKDPLHTCGRYSPQDVPQPRGLHRVWEPQGAQHWHCPGKDTQLQNPRFFQGLKPAWGIPVTLVVLTPLGSLVPARAAAAADAPAPPRRLQRPPRTFYSKQLRRLRQSFRESRLCVPYRECRKLVAQLHLGGYRLQVWSTNRRRRLSRSAGSRASRRRTPLPLTPLSRRTPARPRGATRTRPPLHSCPVPRKHLWTSNVTSAESEDQ